MVDAVESCGIAHARTLRNALANKSWDAYDSIQAAVALLAHPVTKEVIVDRIPAFTGMSRADSLAQADKLLAQLRAELHGMVN